MKWVAMIRDEIRTQQREQNLHLGSLAARTGIPEYRLRTWLDSKTIDDLDYSELVKLHEVLTHDSKSAFESSSKAGTGSEQCGSNGIGKTLNIPFDESD